jgi:hypothetical protein
MSITALSRFGATQMVALGAILSGWFVAAGQHSSSGVWPWLALCLVGLGLSLMTNVLALFTLRRGIVRRFPAVKFMAAAAPGRAGGEWVSGDGMTLFHRPDCLLVTGKHVEAHRGNGRRPCGMCRP